MPYIGKEPKTITTISDLTATGDVSVTGTTALTGNATAAGTLDVTGAITSSAGATITTADNTAQLTLTSTDADANNGPILDLVRDSGSPADGDEVGIVRFKFDDDAGEVNTAARFTAKINDASNGTEDGELEIVTLINGSSRSRIEMLPGETVINEDSQDLDFRVESDNATNAFFVKGDDGKVGVNTAAPNLQMSVNFDTSAVAGFGLHDTNSGNLGGMLQFYSGSGQGTLRANVMNANNDGVHFAVGNGSVVFTQNSYVAANALDDYEEGTFTPEIRIGGSTSGITNNSQVGQYTKIGRMVTLTGRVSISDKGSNSGAMTIAGMPFASQNTSNLESFGVVELQNMSTGTDNLGSLTNNNVYCRISPNVLTIEMRRTMHDANDITNVQMTDTTVVGFTITYFT